MKVFIVFLAFMLVFTGFLAFESDLSRYAAMQRDLKMTAENCACAAALCCSDEAFAHGLKVIEEDEAEAMAGRVLSEAAENARFAGGSLSWSMTLYDDDKGYDGLEKYGLYDDRPAAAVTVGYSGSDMFRLPFLKLCGFSRTAVYQWEYALTSN